MTASHHPAFIDPHGKRIPAGSWTNSTLRPLEPVTVDLGHRKQIPHLGQVGHLAHNVRITHRHRHTGIGSARNGHFHRISQIEHRRAHVNDHIAALRCVGHAHAGPGPDFHLARHRPAASDQVASEDPYSVAAHLGHGSVGVSVVHEVLGASGDLGQGRLLGLQSCGPDDAKHTIRADPLSPITEARHKTSAQPQSRVRVGEQHEVIARPVAFAKRTGPAYEASLVIAAGPARAEGSRADRRRVQPAGVAAQQPVHPLSGQRRAEQVPRSTIATELAKPRARIPGLDGASRRPQDRAGGRTRSALRSRL